MRRILSVVSVVLLMWICAGAWGTTRYVMGSVSASGDGLSWETALKTIQEGIDAASDGDTVTVAKGTYVENIRFNGKNIVLTSTDPLDPAVVAGTIIDGNQAGSVVTFSGTETEACVLSGFTIRNGVAEYGGGIFGGTWDNRTRAAIQHNTISGNWAGPYGGGLRWCAGTIQNNTITGNSAGYGGGLDECNGTIQNNTISGNSAAYGGGLCDCDGTIQNNSISGNSAGMYGGGLDNCDGTIQNNTMTGNLGGWLGGGLAGCEGTIQNNTISGNSAGWGSGGLYGCDGTIQNNTITGNWVWDGSSSGLNGGGGLSDCAGTIQNNTISGNSAGWFGEGGGGLFYCDGTIQDNTISGNSADWGGGLVYCHGTIQNNIITGNSADWGDGGGLYGCGGTIQNNTISGNSATWGGGLYQCSATILNCIIWANTAPDGPQVYECSEPTYSCIEGWTAGGEGNISEDPRFIDADGPDNDPKTYEDNDYHLSPGSPCIDAGKNEDWMWRAVDIDGEPRIARRETNWVVDMGADEYWQGESLSVDVPRTRPIGTGDRHAYEISTPAGENLLIRVESTDPNAVIRLYAGYSFEPGRPGYSYQSDEGQRGALFLVVPDTLEGNCYVFVYGASVSGVSASYTIEAEYVDLFLGRVSPTQAGSGGRATLSIFGAGLDKISKLELVGPTGKVVAPLELIPLSSTRLCATFDLRTAEPAVYGLAVEDVQGHSALFENAIKVTAGGGQELWVKIEGAEQVRANRTYTYELRYGNSGNVDAYGVSMFVELTPDVNFRVGNSDEWQTSRPGQAIHIVFTVLGACSEGVALLTIRTPDAMSVNICADITEDPAQYLDLHSDSHSETLKLLNEMSEGTRTNGMLASGIIPCAEIDTYPPKTGPWEPRPPGYIDLFEIRQPGGSSSYESAVSLGGEELAWSFPSPVDGVVTTPLSSLNLPYGGWEVKHLGSWRPSPNWGAGKKWSELREEVTARLQPYAGYGFDSRSEGDGRISCIGLAGRVSLGDDFTKFVPDLNADGYRDIYEVMSFIWASNGIGVAAEWWSIGDRKRAIRALDDFLLTMVRPIDPNEKVGRAGTGDQRLVGAAEELQYIIYFENQPGATAPAQEVFIRDYLDPALDLATFRPTEIAFGDLIIPVPDFRADFYTRVTIPDYRPEVKKEWWVDITIEFNYSSRLVRWTFRTLDPETGQLPTEDLAGFLPPNDETGRGEGHVAFAIRARPDTPTATVIRNAAAIVFDVEAALVTNEVSNTIADLRPEAAAWPKPADGAQNVGLDAFLDWASSQRAETYDVYLWKQGEARPIVPTANSLTRSDFQPSPPLEPETLYHWQVWARSISGEAPGPEWTFSTEPVGFRVVGLGWLPNGRLRIEFPSLSGRSYSLEGRDSFDSAVWAPQQFYITQDGTAAQTSIQGTGTILRIYAWPAGSRAFYRVATP